MNAIAWQLVLKYREEYITNTMIDLLGIILKKLGETIKS